MELRKLRIITVNEIFELFVSKKVWFVVILYSLLFLVGVKISKYLELLAFFIPNFRHETPFQLLIPFYLGILVLPFICSLLIYDTISFEFENRSLKYILYRVGRKTIIYGKLLAPLILITIINTILYLILVIFLKFKFGPEFINTSIFMLIFLMIYTLLYLVFGLFFSIIIKNPQRSLKASILLIVFMFILPLFKIKFLNYLSPLKYAKDAINLIENGINITAFVTILLFCAYIILLLISCINIFKKKDLY